MKRFVLLSAAVGALTFAGGCQVSGTNAAADANRPRPAADASVTVDRPTTVQPAAQASASVGAGTFDHPYQAALDTPWVSSPNNVSSANQGTVHRGDRVQFSGDVRSDATWQEAKLPDGSIHYVHPSDFRAAP
jgi:hypothetical protein